MENLYTGVVGESTYDNLFAGTSVPVNIKSIKLKAGQGILVRGTVVGIETTSGLAVVTTSSKTDGTQVADSILTDTVDTGTTDAVVATAYSSGLFNRNALIVGAADTVEKHETQLRELGIYLKDNLAY